MLEWLDADEQDGEFVDAERIWRTLDTIARAPRLAAVAADRFLTGLRPNQLVATDDQEGNPESGAFMARPATSSTLAPLGELELKTDEEDLADEAAVAWLVTEGFVDVPVELRNDIERFRRHEEQAAPRRIELEQLYRQMRRLHQATRRNDRELASMGTLFKSKAKEERWEQASKRDRLKTELDDLILARRRLEGEIEKAGNLLRSLLDRINRDVSLRDDGRWIWDRPARLTYDGQFLLAYLDEMNADNFRGRPLAEILDIGASLA